MSGRGTFRFALSLDNLTLCRVSEFFRLSVFRPNVYGLFTTRILDRDQYENYILHLIANDNGDRPMRAEQRHMSHPSLSLNIDDFLKRRLDAHSNAIKSSSVALQSELFVYLTLLDINDNSPIFDKSYISLRVDENLPKNAYLTRLHASDIDKGKNGTVRYELVVKEHQVFFVDAHSGVLRIKRPLDREQCALYRVGVRAHDLGYPHRKYSSLAIIDVQVNNINDHVPYFIHDVYYFHIEENSPIETVVGRLTVDDRDEQEPIEQIINLSTVGDNDLVLLNLTLSTKTSR